MLKKNLLRISAFVVIATSLAACGKGGAVLAKVGNSKITEGDLDALIRVNPRLKARMESPAGKQKMVENYVEQELLYQESVRRGINRSQPVKEKLALYEKILIAQALLEDELDTKAKEYYDNHRDEFEQIKASHILIRTSSTTPEKGKKKGPALKRTEEQALKLTEQIKARLGKGEDFAKVAKEVSEDERTKNNGGDLGFVTIHDKRLERWEWLPIAEKAFALKKDAVSDPIKTKDGFHLVKVIEEKALQPLEEAQGGIRFRIQGDIRNQLLEELTKKYKVEYVNQKEKAAVGQPPVAVEPPPATPEAAPKAEPKP